MSWLSDLFSGAQADPYASQLGNLAKYWIKQSKGPMSEFQNYLYGLFQDPYGKEFQAAWKQQQVESQRYWQPLMNNMLANLQTKMGGSAQDYNSVVPGMQSYLYRMQGKDLMDWLRNYTATAKQSYGQQLFGNYMNLLGQSQSGLQTASQSYQTSAAQQGQNLSNLGKMLGYMYGIA
jgi:hypothetical protein